MTSDAPRYARGPADTCSRRFATFRKTAKIPAPLPRRPPQKTPSFLAPSGSRFRSGQDSRQRRANATRTRNASGMSTPSDNGLPARFHVPSVLRRKKRTLTAFSRANARSHAGLCARCASFPETCVTRVTDFPPAENHEKTMPYIADHGLASSEAIPSPAARRSRRQWQDVPRPFLRAATSAQDSVSRLSAPAASLSRFTRQKRARRPESSL